MKGLLRSDRRSEALFKIVGKEWDMFTWSKKYQTPLLGINKDNLLVILKTLRKMGPKDFTGISGRCFIYDCMT